MKSQEVRGSVPPPSRPSSVRKREAILDGAEKAFLRDGFAAANMDAVAADAGVSKQTVYTHFGSKEALFVAVVRRITSDASDRVHFEVPDPADAGELEPYLIGYATRQLSIVLDARLLAVRRLVIAESARFPELAHAFWEHGPARAMDTMRGRFARFTAAGMLRATDAAAAAASFNWLVMGEALNIAMLRGDSAILDDAARERVAREAARVFLAAYG